MAGGDVDGGIYYRKVIGARREKVQEGPMIREIYKLLVTIYPIPGTRLVDQPKSGER